MAMNVIPKFYCLLIISFLMLVLFYYLNKYNLKLMKIQLLVPLKEDNI